MSTLPLPRQVSSNLARASQDVENPTLQQNLREGAETIEYLLILLDECANYIESVKEYNLPPRFIKAVREALS